MTVYQYLSLARWIGWVCLLALIPFFLRRRRNGLESKAEGAADNGCEPSSRWWMTRPRVWLVFYLLTRLSGMQGDWWAAESWPGAALFGRHSVFLGLSALWVKYTEQSLALHAVDLETDCPSAVFKSTRSPLSIPGPQNIRLTPLIRHTIL